MAVDADLPMRLKVEFVPEKENEERRDRDVARDEGFPVKRMFEDRVPLDEQEEDVKGKIAPVEPDTPKGFIGERFDADALLLCPGSDAEVGEDD